MYGTVDEMTFSRLHTLNLRRMLKFVERCHNRDSFVTCSFVRKTVLQRACARACASLVKSIPVV